MTKNVKVKSVTGFNNFTAQYFYDLKREQKKKTEYLAFSIDQV
jgi:hypothetical protein